MSATPSIPALVFPTPVVTAIVGRPTNSSLQVLQQQLYQNARAIASDRGGGALGHLALIMPPDQYLLREGTIAFAIPNPPGLMAAHAAGSSSLTIANTVRNYNQSVVSYHTYQAVRTALQNQIISAVAPTYLQALCDADFGFSDVEPYVMLAHLKTTYGKMTGIEVEQNRARLSESWDPTSPIEDLWARITEIRRIATNAEQPISDPAVIALVLPMFERTGLFLHSVNSWNSFELAEQTYAKFVTHFTRANELRVTALTSADVRYADALRATAVTPPRATSTRADNDVIVSGTKFYYCWSHGLSTYDGHTSKSCRQPKSGHQVDATAFNRLGGVNTFNTKEDKKPPGFRGPSSTTHVASN